MEKEKLIEIKELLKNRKDLSISFLQMHFGIGFLRGSKIIEELEKLKIIAPINEERKRIILNKKELLKFLEKEF